MVSYLYSLKYKSLYINKQFSTIALYILILTSCVTQRKIEYLQDRNENSKAFNEVEFPDYRLKPFDELFVQINSLDEGATNAFSNSPDQQSMAAMDPHLLSYTIDKDGYVVLPVVGRIFLKDKTLSEVNSLLRDSLNHVLNQPVSNVKLINRYISILGEVRNPGHFPYTQEKLTIYEALGLAGDINDYGNRRKIILIRNENEKNLRINIDLRKSDILVSDYYNLRPNDILYIKPLRSKFWIRGQTTITLLLSTLTTGLLFYELITSQ